MLTAVQIQKLAARKGVRRIAVENFLGTLGHEGSARAAIYNAHQDGRAYQWNAATVTAIVRGIELYYAK